MPVKKKITLLIIFVILVTAAGVYFTSRTRREPVPIRINSGASAAVVAGKLEEKDIISNSKLFLRVIKILGKDREIKAGTYYISPSAGYLSIIKTLSSGNEHLVRVTIPEGFRTEQIAVRLQRKNIIDNPGEFVRKVEERDLRGFLFPETYHFPEKMPVDAVINIMLSQFNSVFTREWKERARKLGFTVKEIVTLASLIEMETRVPEERPIISDIFHKRLDKRMYLESCATIQFILGEVRPHLTYNDLDAESPYNTYRNFGLPPTPIASPGRPALEAALYPADTDYLFFFVKEDGSHEFSSNYEEHLRKQREKRARLPGP